MKRVCLLFCALLAASACSGPMLSAVGESDDLVIVTSDVATEQLTRAAIEVGEHPVPWLLDEPTFKTSVRTLSEIKGVTNRRHLLLVGTWEDEMGKFAGRRFEQLTAGGGTRMAISNDVWAEGQVVAAVVGPNERAVAEYLSANARDIIGRIERASLDRLAAGLCSTQESRRMSEALVDRFGWSLCLPKEYELFTTPDDVSFAFFRRTRPDRTVFVAWRDGGPDDVTPELAAAWRATLSAMYLDGDEIEERRPFLSDRTTLSGLEAVRLTGWWANRRLVGGGPFVSYCFYAPEQERVYMVDASLFAPSFDKTALMRNLEGIVTTFRPGNE